MTATPADCVHLTVDIVREIHKSVVDEFGGLALVLDVASSKLDREQTTERLRRLLEPARRRKK